MQIQSSNRSYVIFFPIGLFYFNAGVAWISIGHECVNSTFFNLETRRTTKLTDSLDVCAQSIFDVPKGDDTRVLCPSGRIFSASNLYSNIAHARISLPILPRLECLRFSDNYWRSISEIPACSIFGTVCVYVDVSSFVLHNLDIYM